MRGHSSSPLSESIRLLVLGNYRVIILWGRVTELSPGWPSKPASQVGAEQMRRSVSVSLVLWTTLNLATAVEDEVGLARTSSTNFCPPGSQFSAFGFASFILIALQTVINIVNASNSNNNNNNNNNNNGECQIWCIKCKSNLFGNQFLSKSTLDFSSCKLPFNSIIIFLTLYNR